MRIMGFEPTQYTLETVPLLGIEPNEFREYCLNSGFFNVSFILGAYYDISEMANCADSSDHFPNGEYQTFQPGLTFVEKGVEKLIVSIDFPQELELGYAMPIVIGNIEYVSVSYCNPLVQLREF